MRDHEAGVDAAVFHQEGRQLRHVFVHHHRNAALGNRADFGQCQRDVVGRHRHRLGMEIAAGEDFVVIGEHQRVIGNGVGLHRQHGGGLAQLGQCRTHHLRLAAQAVGVLHLAAFGMRQADFALLAQEVAVNGGGIDLALLAAYRMDARVKRRTRTQSGLYG